MITCPCCETRIDPAKTGKPRSYDQHKRFFALCRAFFHHWPETADKQFGDETEMRVWAQMKAGYRDIAAQIPLVGLPRDKALMIVEAAIRAAGSNAVPVLHKDKLVIFKPRSISYASLPHLQACALFDAVETVLEQESGLKADQLMAEKAA